MSNYNIVVYNDKEKYELIDLIRKNGYTLLNVAGYYNGYYISFNTDDDKDTIEQKLKLNE